VTGPKDNDASGAMERARALLASLPQPKRPQGRTRSQSGSEPNVQSLTLRAETVAAVSGALEPASLLACVDLSPDDGLGRTLLNTLAPSFHVEVKGGKTWWSLHAEPRAEILEEVDGRIVDFSKLPETDEFGKMLRRVLDPEDDLTENAVNQLEADDLLSLIAATEAVPGDQIDKPDLELLRARLSRLRLDDTGKTLVKNFVGRHDELARLRTFLTKPSTNLWSGLLVTGLGGAGKSTLVAKFVADVRKQKMATAIVLDFDRPGIDPRDGPALELEISRLVGMDRPELEPRLRGARDRDWERRLKAGAEQRSTSEAREAELSLMSLSEVGEALRSLPQASAVLLVLDTFEEVTQLGFQHKLIDWVTRVADRLSPLPLKVLISGRLFDADTTLGSGRIEKEPLHLGELTDDFAVQLLCREVASSSQDKHTMPEAFARELVADKLIPRRPLELKLVARMYQDSPEELDQLKRDLREGGEKLRGLFAGLVYRRILTRMKGAGDTVKAVAFPGLVLRYVTPELIRSVLAPCLGLPEMSPQAAADAFDSLARYGWFMQRESTGELRYRRDLRRATLKVARAQETEKTRLIHEAAISWFDKREHAEPAEVVYHRLMLVDQNAIAPAFLQAIKAQAKNVRSDSEDLPPLGEALLLFAAEEPMRPEQISCLPSPYREEAYRRKGRSAAEAGEFGLAFAMHEQFRRRAKLPAYELDQWEIEALFANVEWRDCSGRRPRFTGASDWREFVVDVFTGAVLESVGLERLDELEVAPGSPERVFLVKDADPFSQTDLARMAFAFALRDGLPVAQSMLRLRDLLKRRVDENRARSGPWTSRLSLLDLLGGRREAWAEILLATPISLDPNTHPAVLEMVNSLVPRLGDREPALAALLGKIARIVNEGVRGRWTARSILAAVNAISGFAPTCLEGLDLAVPDPRISPSSSLHPAQAFDKVVAVDPEFRDPVRFALRDAFGDDPQALRQTLASVVPFHLDDLDPEGFQRELSGDSEHALSPQVELIDRCGATGELLGRARQLRPDSEKLRLVAEAHSQWRAALRRLFELGESEPTKTPMEATA
jgi:hypothetical protein